jgi:acetylornithine deacetylase/succinyl-diaminopimelate desuccinylase-like protein
MRVSAKIDPGEQPMPDGTNLPLPPVLFIKFLADPAKRTVLVYGHYDVQPAHLSDGACPVCLGRP